MSKGSLPVHSLREQGESHFRCVDREKAYSLLGLRCEGHFRQSVWLKGKWENEYLYAPMGCATSFTSATIWLESILRGSSIFGM
jgi:hypothetical protein